MITRLNRKHKGFTLLEVLTVVAITAVLFGLGAKWLLSLNKIANDDLLKTDTTQMTFALDKLENDLRNTQSCKMRPEVRETNADILRFTSKDETGSFVEIVWTIYDNNLYRASLPLDANCEPVMLPENAEDPYKVLAANVAGNPNLFQYIQSGELASIDCTRESCDVDAVKVLIKSQESVSFTVRTLNIS